MKKKEKNINDKKYNNYIFNQTGMWIQFILFILIIATAITGIFNPLFLKICTIITGLTLLVMAINNYRIYKRKLFTFFYITMGVIVLIIGVLELLK